MVILGCSKVLHQTFLCKSDYTAGIFFPINFLSIVIMSSFAGEYNDLFMTKKSYKYLQLLPENVGVNFRRFCKVILFLVRNE